MAPKPGQKTTPEQVAEAVQRGARYQNTDAGLVLHLSSAELGKGRSYKDAVKAVRAKLHQVGSAYHTGVIDFPAWTAELDALPADPAAPEMEAFCRRLMEQHASTSERLPYIEDFFFETLESLGQIDSVLDLACGLNPLAISWMPLKQGARYHACDIYSDMVAFLNSFFAHTRVAGEAHVCNLVETVPAVRVQLALLLKSIPCLEHLDRGIGPRLLDTVPADHLLVSFPVRSLGGRSKGMVENYEQRFQAMLAGRPWRVRRFQFPTELAFLLTSTR